MIKNVAHERLGEILLLKDKNLYYKLTVIFGLFFPVPIAGFLIFGFKYIQVLKDQAVPLFFIAALSVALWGHIILRNIFKKVITISHDITKKIIQEIGESQIQPIQDELDNIIVSFDTIEKRFDLIKKKLGRKTSEISMLKELSDLCYVTFDAEEILYIMLERALKLVNADVGSVLLLEKPYRKSFIVQSTIGLGDVLSVGERIDFSTSIAKYAVINKSPVIVENIEKDNRFARTNRPTYATKSFICMPIKTMKDIIGVITVSRKDDNTLFSNDDVDILFPLVSTAAFTYENLRLTKQAEIESEYLKVTEKLLKDINSSFKENELLSTFLKDLQSIIPFKLAMILLKDENNQDNLYVFDIFSRETINVSQGFYFSYKGSLLENVINQGTTIFIEDLSTLDMEIEPQLLFSYKYKSCLLSALKIDNDSKGILLLYVNESHVFSMSSEFIDIIANSVSLAIAKNKLAVSIKKRKKELDTLSQIGNVLASSTFDIDQVLKYTMDMVQAVMNVEAGSLLLLHNNELEFKVTFNVNIETMKQFKLKLGQGIAGYAATSGKSVIINDVRQSPHFASEIDNSTGFITKSALCVPIISQGKVLGVIELLNKINGDFTYSDKTLLQSIASSVSIAMENSRLYRETVSMTEHERGIRQIFQKFVPKEVVDKIIHGEHTGKNIVDELRTLTLLNIDIRGFSKLATKIGPPKTVSMLNYFFSTMGGIVFNNHGIVDKYLGDGFLAIFGAPVSSPNDVDNAVIGALEMKKSIETVSNHFSNKIGAPVAVGISIHTGEVVIGNIGFDKKIDYTVIGDPVNTVFRLQAITKSISNGILISEKTYRAAQSRLIVREMGTYEIDSTLGALKVYELLGVERG